MQRSDISLPIVEVTVQEDRAQVLRRAVVTVPTGVSTLVLPGVAPVLVDKTLIARLAAGTAAGAASGAGRVIDVRCERLSLPATDDPARRDATAHERLRLAQQRVSQLETAAKVAVRGIEQAQAAGKLAVAEMSLDAAAGKADPIGWREALAEATRREREQRLRLVEVEAQTAEAKQVCADLGAQLAAMGAPPAMSARIVVVVEVAQAGQITLEISYVVPGACWRPAHTAQFAAAASADHVTWTAEGCVWQRTGEDWRDVRLFLSTDRPSLGTTPPELSVERLRLTPRAAVVTVETRDRVIEDAGPAGSQPSAEMPGIDDGGEVRTIPVAGTATVPADGLPHRFPLATFTHATRGERIVHAEIAEAAVLRTRVVNALPIPLLAGPVDLLRNGGLAGRASIAFVAPGAGFDLGWGPEAAVRVRRTHREVHEKGSMLSQWTPRLHVTDLVLSNLGAAPQRLLVAERIPVSEVEQVRIELADETSPAVTPDADGICRWTIDLPPNGRSEIHLHWRLLTKSQVAGV
jgi:uncharacterized protein (TIGR02231 family)